MRVYKTLTRQQATFSIISALIIVLLFYKRIIKPDLNKLYKMGKRSIILKHKVTCCRSWWCTRGLAVLLAVGVHVGQPCFFVVILNIFPLWDQPHHLQKSFKVLDAIKMGICGTRHPHDLHNSFNVLSHSHHKNLNTQAF